MQFTHTLAAMLLLSTSMALPLPQETITQAESSSGINADMSRSNNQSSISTGSLSSLSSRQESIQEAESSSGINELESSQKNHTSISMGSLQDRSPEPEPEPQETIQQAEASTGINAAMNRTAHHNSITTGSFKGSTGGGLEDRSIEDDSEAPLSDSSADEAMKTKRQQTITEAESSSGIFADQNRTNTTVGMGSLENAGKGEEDNGLELRSKTLSEAMDETQAPNLELRDVDDQKF